MDLETESLFLYNYLYSNWEESMKRFFNLMIAAVLAMGFHVSAFAQTVEEVTVTAARQAESLQDIALSVQAITGEDLMEQHIETAADLADSTTGVSFSNGIGSGVGIKLRGLIVPGIGAATVAAADLQLNGHSASQSAWAEVGFLDAERLEILEGPQGTLYGRNTTTGLMNLISARPGAGNYLKATAGEDGYTMVKTAMDFDLRSNVQGRVAISKFDKDGVVNNLGTGNMIDNRDAFGARLSLDWAIDDNNQLNFNYDSYSINDNRLNLGTASCNRESFFGCSPDTKNVEAHINRPVFTSGTVSNTFDTLTFITTGTDTLAAADTARSKDINTVRKSYDARRQQKSSLAQLEYITGFSVAPGDLELRVKATNSNTAYYQVDDNDHGDSVIGGTASKIGSGFQPRGSMTIASLATTCFGTETSIQFAGASECSRAQNESNAFEINVTSDFDNHNFVVGAYNDNNTGINEYTIQTTAYLLMNDFAQHPLSAMFSGALDGYGGSSFYGTLAAVLGGNAASLGGAIATAGGDITAAGVKTVANSLVNTIKGGCAGTYVGNDSAGVAKVDKNGGACTKSMPHQAGGLINDQRTRTESKAIFGEYYYTFLDNWKLTLGGRYMENRFETRTVNGLSDGAYNIGVKSYGYANGLRNSNSSVCREANYEACWQAAHVLAWENNYADTYKGVLQYSYDQGMAYVSMTTGDRAGGANPDGSKFKGSKATSYEVGSKNILMDGRLKLNANIFRHEQADSPYSLIRGNSAYTEPHDILHQGLQLDTQFFITDSLALAANVLLTDSEFVTSTTGEGRGPGNSLVSIGSKSIDPHNPDQSTSWSGSLNAAGLIAHLQDAANVGVTTAFTAAQATARQGAVLATCNGAGLTGCSVSAYNVSSAGNILMNPTGLAQILGSTLAPAGSNALDGAVYKELGGNKIPGVSDMEATVSLSQLYEGLNGSGAVRLGYSFKDAFTGDMYNNARFNTGAQEYIDLNATYEPNQGDWYVNLWAKNLADKRQMTATNRTSNLQGAVIFVTYSEGMRAGLDFGINF
jgi:outer membrane receptor protein involved in Fe transport